MEFVKCLICHSHLCFSSKAHEKIHEKSKKHQYALDLLKENDIIKYNYFIKYKNFYKKW